MKRSELAIIQDTFQRIERIRKEADAQIIKEQEELTKAFQEIHGVDRAEARYLIFQAELRHVLEG